MNESTAWHKEATDKWHLLAAMLRNNGRLTDKDVKRMAWRNSVHERYIIILDLLEHEGAIKIDREAGEYLHTDKTSDKLTYYFGERERLSREGFYIKAQGWLILITAFSIVISTIFQGLQLSQNTRESEKIYHTAKQLNTLTTTTIPLLEKNVSHLVQVQDTLIKRQANVEELLKNQKH